MFPRGNQQLLVMLQQLGPRMNIACCIAKLFTFAKSISYEHMKVKVFTWKHRLLFVGFEGNADLGEFGAFHAKKALVFFVENFYFNFLLFCF